MCFLKDFKWLSKNKLFYHHEVDENDGTFDSFVVQISFRFLLVKKSLCRYGIQENIIFLTRKFHSSANNYSKD